MISTSDAWRTAHQQTIVPEAFVEITYDVTEPGLQEDATLTNNGTAGYAQAVDIVDTTNKSHPLYATLEENVWGLNGSFNVLPDAAPYGDTAYVSSMQSDSDGTFSSVPVITLSFSSVREQPIPGITITWSSAYEEYATRFRITALNGTAQVFSREFENTTVQTVCELALAEYTEIRLEILAWCLPFHRARLERIFLGISQTYTKADLFAYTHSQSGDLLSAELPKNSVQFSLNNVDGIWNPDNLTGNVRFLAEQQKISIRYGYKLDNNVEWIDAGTFWISEWETPSNGLEVRFVARDLLEFMSDFYAGKRSGTLYAIAEAALIQAELPVMGDGTPRYRISDNLKEWSVDFSNDDSDYTLAEIVQLCANAACCVMYQDRKGMLRIEPLRENASGYAVKRYISYAHPEFHLTKPLKSVSVNDGMGTAENGPAGEIQTLDNSLITDEIMANRVAEWVRKTLEGRRTLSGEYRADPSLDVFDKIAVESKYGMNNAIYVTNIEYSYAGAFKGRYEGRITEFKPDFWFAGELKAGDFKDG